MQSVGVSRARHSISILLGDQRPIWSIVARRRLYYRHCLSGVLKVPAAETRGNRKREPADCAHNAPPFIASSSFEYDFSFSWPNCSTNSNRDIYAIFFRFDPTFRRYSFRDKERLLGILSSQGNSICFELICWNSRLDEFLDRTKLGESMRTVVAQFICRWIRISEDDGYRKNLLYYEDECLD